MNNVLVWVLLSIGPGPQLPLLSVSGVYSDAEECRVEASQRNDVARQRSAPKDPYEHFFCAKWSVQ